MTRITLDAELRRRLLDLSQPLELCDESGNVLGQFVPAPCHEEFVPDRPQISEAELRRRAESTGRTYTTAEVLKYLESL